MTTFLVILGTLVMLVVVAALNAFFGKTSNLLEDLRNRNDRGKLKRPSEKYVSRQGARVYASGRRVDHSNEEERR